MEKERESDIKFVLILNIVNYYSKKLNFVRAVHSDVVCVNYGASIRFVKLLLEHRSILVAERLDQSTGQIL